MEFALTNDEKKVLLKFVRDTLEVYLKNGKAAPFPELTKNLQAECGAFVTLHREGLLRGCIGNMVGTRPLINTIQQMAVASATQDPRFQPVRYEELKLIDIEISVLSPLKEIHDVNEIKVGVHGILISKGFYSGVLLPQVATEEGWDRATFLEHTCLKAGLSRNAWKDKAAKIEIFSAQVFGEKKDKEI